MLLVTHWPNIGGDPLTQLIFFNNFVLIFFLQKKRWQWENERKICCWWPTDPLMQSIEHSSLSTALVVLLTAVPTPTLMYSYPPPDIGVGWKGGWLQWMGWGGGWMGSGGWGWCSGGGVVVGWGGWGGLGWWGGVVGVDGWGGWCGVMVGGGGEVLGWGGVVEGWGGV